MFGACAGMAIFLESIPIVPSTIPIQVFVNDFELLLKLTKVLDRVRGPLILVIVYTYLFLANINNKITIFREWF